MSINLSNTLPAPVAGATNVVWQEDASGNVSACMPLGGIGTKTTLFPIAGVLTLDASVGNSFFINVISSIISMVILNGTDGQEITILWAQDSTGHSVNIPSTGELLLGPFSITTTANKHSCYKFSFNSADTNWYQIGANNM